MFWVVWLAPKLDWHRSDWFRVFCPYFFFCFLLRWNLVKTFHLGFTLVKLMWKEYQRYFSLLFTVLVYTVLLSTLLWWDDGILYNVGRSWFVKLVFAFLLFAFCCAGRETRRALRVWYPEGRWHKLKWLHSQPKFLEFMRRYRGNAWEMDGSGG